MNDQAKTYTQPQRGDNHKVTVLAPTPQDAKYCDQVLREHGVPVEFVTSVYEVIGKIHAGAGVLLIAQEFLNSESMDHLRCSLCEQPSWSDVPILVLLNQCETSARVIADLLSLGHVTLIARPLRIALLVSMLKAKLRDRARQYEVRDLLQEAQQASQSKSEFVANMSHEIRTPMTSILGYAELMSNLVENKEALGYLSTIRRNGDYLLEIINDILDLSKIEAGKFDTERKRFQPAQLIEDVRSVMEVRANEGGLMLEIEYQGKLPKVIESDAKRLKQILINLVGNAIKFTEKGSVRIIVRYDGGPDFQSDDAASKKLETDPTLQFDIIDTGIGMSDEQKDRLFKPFSQGDSSVSRHFGGTGLGLAISQRLAEMLGGRIEVSSTQGVGSTFRVSIATGKLNDSQLVDYSDSVQEAKAAALKDSKPTKLNCRVLVVDDRRDIRFLSKSLLKTAGATVDECEDGRLAVEHISNCLGKPNVPDVILLDMQMPNLDGYQTARELRILGYQGPIIALTADAMQGDMNKCLEAGCNGYLSKPINNAAMLQKIAELLPVDHNRR